MRIIDIRKATVGSSGRTGNATHLAGWLLVVLAVLPFAEVRLYPHVHDDHLLRGPGSVAADTTTGWGTLLTADFFGTPQRPSGNTTFWRPVILASFRLEALLSGGSAAAMAWLGHVVTVLCHAAAVLALWRLLLELGAAAGTALIAAALFAVHPVHVESVAWASGRTDSLPAALVWVGSALWIARPSTCRAALSLLLMALALLSKEPALVLVALAPLLARSRGLSWTQALWPPVAAVLAVLSLRAVAFGLAPEVDLSGYMGPDAASARWFTWASIVPDLVGLTLWPGPYTPLRPVAPALSWGAPGVIAGLGALVLCASCCLIAWRRRRPAWVFATALVLLTLLALAPWARFPTGYREVAGPLFERYVYAMAAAPCFAVAWLLAPLTRRSARLPWIAALLVGATLGPLTAERARAWSSDEAFAQAGLAAAPRSADMWTHLGSAQLETFRTRGDQASGDAALISFAQALEIDTEHRIAALNRFITLALMGQERRATLAAGELLTRWPADAAVLDNVANWHARAGRFAEAARLFELELATGSPLPAAATALQACRAALALPQTRGG